MPEKLTGHLATHVPATVERQIQRLAAFAGMTTSEYLRDLVFAHLDQKRVEHELMSEVFGAPGAMRAPGSGR